MADLNPCLIC